MINIASCLHIVSPQSLSSTLLNNYVFDTRDRIAELTLIKQYESNTFTFWTYSVFAVILKML